MDWSIIIENLALYRSGFFVTLQLVSISLVIGLLFAIPLAVIRTSKNYIVTAPVRAFIYFFRGTPLLVQIYLMYHGLPILLKLILSFYGFDVSQNLDVALKDTFLLKYMWVLFKEAYFCALVAFTLNTCAYTTEIIRGAIEGPPFGEIEAAISCGMSRFKMMKRIILPSAFRRALPSYGNEVIFMLHGSAIASVITIEDLTGVARIINSKYASPYEAFIAAGVLYLCLTFILVGCFKLLEKKWYAHLRRDDN